MGKIKGQDTRLSRRPFEERTPATEAAMVCDGLVQQYLDSLGSELSWHEMDDDDIAAQPVLDVWRLVEKSEVDGEEVAAEIQDSDDEAEVSFLSFMVIFAYCRDAVLACKRGENATAWKLMSEANYWYGCVTGNISATVLRLGESRSAQNAAMKRHARSQSAKAWARAAYRESYASLSQRAAAPIICDQIPRKLGVYDAETVRKWLSGLSSAARKS